MAAGGCSCIVVNRQWMTHREKTVSEKKVSVESYRNKNSINVCRIMLIIQAMYVRQRERLYQRQTEYKVRDRVVEIQYTREILRESESLYSDTSGSTWQSSGPPNYNLLHADCYTTRTREEEDVRWKEEEETTHRGDIEVYRSCLQ